LAKWHYVNILHFHAFSLNYADYDYRLQNNSPTLFNRRSINTVGSGAGTNSGEHLSGAKRRKNFLLCPSTF